jgi:hypothetical protein
MFIRRYHRDAARVGVKALVLEPSEEPFLASRPAALPDAVKQSLLFQQ